MTAQHDFPTAGAELRHLLVVSNYARSLAFYRDVLGATVVREFPGTLCFLSFGGGQILLTVPGGPTQDKPTVTFASVFCQSAFFNVVEKTILGVLFKTSANTGLADLPAGVGQKLAIMS